MISACGSQEFVPYGRQYVRHHPGCSPIQLNGSSVRTDHGLPLVKALHNISLRDNVKKDMWKVGECDDADSCSEELYITEHTVVWSRGMADGAGQTVKSFTMDSLVQDAIWCTFLLPADTDPNREVPSPDQEKPAVKQQKGVCIMESGSVSIFTTEGKDYVTALPFQVSKMWPIRNGLLFERMINEPIKDVSKTPKKDQPHLPVLFSMLHPLDEVAPVICRTGGASSTAKISFVTGSSQNIVFTSKEPSLVMTYDRILGVHSVWNLRVAKPEEAYAACGGSIMEQFPSSIHGVDGQPTPEVYSHSASGLSRLTFSSQSPSLSPFRSYGSRVNSPLGGTFSRGNSPSLSRIAALSRSQSPSVAAGSLYRFETPSPQMKSSPAGCARTPLSLTGSGYGEAYGDVSEPLAPEVCQDHLWTESANVPRDGMLGQGSKVFLSVDLCGQQYLCYVVAYRNHFRCVKFEESNDRSQLIFGSLSIINARDAAPLPALRMILILDMNYQLVLYSGTTQMNQVHVAGLPSASSLSAHLPQPSTPFGSPMRLSSGPVFTSSRPPSAMDARFDDDVRLLSPVPTEFNDSSQVIDSSLNEEPSFTGTASASPIVSLRDPVQNRVTLELVDGSMFQMSLPKMTSSPVIELCLEAIKQVLPKDISMQVLVRWYSTHNAPGSINGQSEWKQFLCCLLSMLGYDVTRLPLTRQQDADSSTSPVIAPKKAKPSDQGCDEDWDYLLASEHHKLVERQCQILGLPNTQRRTAGGDSEDEVTMLEGNGVLFPHMPAILFALHLVYEEMKLDVMFLQDLPQVAALLSLLARDLGCVDYVDHYCRDHPELFSVNCHPRHITTELLKQLQFPANLSQEPPGIYQWVYNYLRGCEFTPYPILPAISNRTKKVITMYIVLLEGLDPDESTLNKYIRRVLIAGRRAPAPDASLLKSFTGASHSIVATVSAYEKAVLCMADIGTSLKERLTFGISLALKEAVYHCRSDPPSDWPEQAYALIGREDLARQCSLSGISSLPRPNGEPATPGRSAREEEDGMEYMDKELLGLCFNDDLRIQEVRRLLQSSRPVRIALTQRPEVSDHEFIEEQERHLYATCIRTMSLPMGRGMFTLSTYQPVPTETLPIPKLCLTGRAPPRNTTVDLNHIDTPPNMHAWPQFHNGVSAGLRIANSSQVGSTWIMYNKPRSNELTSEHAGFLMGLGLNGHLSSLAMLNVHDYLCKGHEMTSVGLLLGISAGKCGTMDVSTTRVLSIHVDALLPPTSTELDVPHNTQVAAILGVGLVYQGTAHRHIAEVLLAEIGRPPGPEMENSTDRDSYALSAGLALGLVMLRRGSEALGLSDLSMADQLYHYMVGGHKRPLTGANKERYKSPSYQIKEGDCVNVDVTSPGSTLALGMMFFSSGNSSVAEWLRAPDTQFLLDFVRPDFLLLRIVAHGLVMWNQIHPSHEWLNNNIPEIVQKYAFQKDKYENDPDCDIDFETMNQAYCNIVAGACLVLALRFAGSANESALKILLSRAKQALKLLCKISVAESAGRSTLEHCLVTVVLSLAIVMSGTGNLEVLRLCRHLRSRVGPSYNYVLYGSHMAVSMAIGLLFMGGGRLTLSTRPESVAAMLCAFFPKFPIHSNDNRYHLQAFRHLYVLAAEPRLILPRDVDSSQACYVPLLIKFKDCEFYRGQTYETMAPCLLPELRLIEEVRVLGKRYWPVTFHKEYNWAALKNILHSSGCLYVKQRAGHLSYAEDPKGYHSVLSRSLTSDQCIGKAVKSEDIKSFSSDACILAFAEHFCHSKHEQEYEVTQFLSRVLYECVSQEKPEVIPTHISIEGVIQEMCSPMLSLALWQLKLMCAFYDRLNEPVNTGKAVNRRLVSQELLASTHSRVENVLHHWQKESSHILANYLSGNSSALSGLDCRLLSCALTWLDLPQPSRIAQLCTTGVPSFAELYKLLQPCGLSVSAVMTMQAAVACENS